MRCQQQVPCRVVLIWHFVTWKTRCVSLALKETEYWYARPAGRRLSACPVQVPAVVWLAQRLQHNPIDMACLPDFCTLHHFKTTQDVGRVSCCSRGCTRNGSAQQLQQVVPKIQLVARDQKARAEEQSSSQTQENLVRQRIFAGRSSFQPYGLHS